MFWGAPIALQRSGQIFCGVSLHPCEIIDASTSSQVKVAIVLLVIVVVVVMAVIVVRAMVATIPADLAVAHKTIWLVSIRVSIGQRLDNRLPDHIPLSQR